MQHLNAVGGHSSKKDKKGPSAAPILTSTADNTILKPLQTAAQPGRRRSRGDVEAEFYAAVSVPGHPLKPYVPRFHGVVESDNNGDGDGDGKRYLKLEDLTGGMARPCVLDLKMGQRTYDETATDEKIAKERKKFPPQEEIGFRIVGMRVVRPLAEGEGGEVFESTREWCMALTAGGMRAAIERYFFDGSALRYDLVQRLVDRLECIRKVLTDAPMYRMYGSSLLVVYDAAALGEERGNLDVRMIDFAHVFDITDGGKDDGYLHGVSFLLTSLRTTLSTLPTPHPHTLPVGGAHSNISHSNDGTLLKRETDPVHFNREVAFYRSAWNLGPDLRPLSEGRPDALTRFLPRLLRLVGGEEGDEGRGMVLEDATMEVRGGGGAVSLMDVKLGSRSWRTDCGNEPLARYYEKYAASEVVRDGRADEVWSRVDVTGGNGGGVAPDSLHRNELGKRDYLGFRDAATTSRHLGFRLTALAHGGYAVSQDQSRAIASEAVFRDQMERFLTTTTTDGAADDGGDGGGGFSPALAEGLVARLDRLLDAVGESEVYRACEMVGTSLLLLHCGGRVAVRWIDFANPSVRGVNGDVGGGGDNGVEDGIRRLRGVIAGLLETHGV